MLELMDIVSQNPHWFLLVVLFLLITSASLGLFIYCKEKPQKKEIANFIIDSTGKIAQVITLLVTIIFGTFAIHSLDFKILKIDNSIVIKENRKLSENNADLKSENFELNIANEKLNKIKTSMDAQIKEAKYSLDSMAIELLSAHREKKALTLENNKYREEQKKLIQSNATLEKKYQSLNRDRQKNYCIGIISDAAYDELAITVARIFDDAKFEYRTSPSDRKKEEKITISQIIQKAITDVGNDDKFYVQDKEKLISKIRSKYGQIAGHTQIVIKIIRNLPQSVDIIFEDNIAHTYPVYETPQKRHIDIDEYTSLWSYLEKIALYRYHTELIKEIDKIYDNLDMSVK